MKKLSEIYEGLNQEEPLAVLRYGMSRDGGSQNVTFSDGFTCMLDYGIGSPTRGKFVKSLTNKTVIDLPQKYKDVLKEYKYFQNKDLL